MNTLAFQWWIIHANTTNHFLWSGASYNKLQQIFGRWLRNANVLKIKLPKYLNILGMHVRHFTDNHNDDFCQYQ